MKFFQTLITLWIVPLTAFCSSPTEEFQAAMVATDIPDRPPSPSFGDRQIDPSFLPDIKKLPLDRKEKLAAQITPLVPRLAQAQGDPPLTGGMSPLAGILILKEIGTDEQKIEAFRDLDLYGPSLSAACEALATCEGTEGVEILEQYAESHFAELDTELAKDGSRTPEGRAHTKPDVNIYIAVIALAGAYHPDGPVAADKLKNRLLDLAKVRLDETRLAAVEKEFSKDMERARHSRENLIREKRPDNKRNPKPESISTETSGASSDLLSKTIHSKMWFWPAVSIATVFLGLACWKLIRKPQP